MSLGRGAPLGPPDQLMDQLIASVRWTECFIFLPTAAWGNMPLFLAATSSSVIFKVPLFDLLGLNISLAGKPFVSVLVLDVWS